MSTLPTIAQCIELHAQAVNKADVLFSGLTQAQLNQRPSPGTWGVGLCLEHLLVTDSTYGPIIDLLLNQTYKPSLWSRISPFSTLIGQKLATEMLTENIAPAKVPPAFKPNEQQTVGADIVVRFVAHGHQLQGQLHQLANLDQALVVPSPALGLITYTLSDCIRILCGHTARHVRQAERALAAIRANKLSVS